MEPTKTGTLGTTVSLVCVTLIAFAANSILCRLALASGQIDAASFTTLRIISGAVALALIVWGRDAIKRAPKRERVPLMANARTIIALFVYMVFFSFAYLSLAAGTGALILFGAVQITMFAIALRNGEHFSLISWVGFALAIAGLVYLVSPGLSAPDPLGSAMMAIAGLAWGLYSLWGRGAKVALRETSRNFTGCIVLALVVSAAFWSSIHVTRDGIILSIVSGAVTSGCGYAIWYAVLPRLRATQASTLQLLVPAIAALGGVLVLSEELSIRLIIASVATLGGVAIVLAQRSKKAA